MIKVVIDTNVFISSIYGGKPRMVIDLWKNEAFKLVISKEVFEEYIKVLKRFDFSPEVYNELVELFNDNERVLKVYPLIMHSVIKDDEADNKFIDCAVAGKATFIVSGDKHLKNLKRYKGIKLCSPSDFLEVFKQ